MTELAVLHLGKASTRTRALAVATNKRLTQRHLTTYVVKIPPRIAADPDARLTLTPALLDAVEWAARMLGASKTTLTWMQTHDEVPIGVQRMILNPGRRTDDQKALGAQRMAALEAQRAKRAAELQREQRQHGTSSRTKAVNAFLAKVGTREQPPGSNGGGLITVMETYWGFGRVAWCGIAAGYHAERFGGIDLRSDVASVSAIEQHARARHSPYGQWVSDPREAFTASFVVIGGPGVHVGMQVEALSDGSAKTVEGNTSFGSSGSQSNGGCIAARVRSPQEIYGVATMHYPG
jgi:hypothetical protein